MRYALFAGDWYYPGGGWNDFRGAFESVEAASGEILVVEESTTYGEAWEDYDTCDWAHVVDLQTMEVVWRSDTKRHHSFNKAILLLKRKDSQ